MWHNQSKTDDCKPSSLEWSKRSPVCLAQLPLFNIAQANGLCKNCPCPINSIDASLLRLFAFRHHEFSVQFPVTCSLWFLSFFGSRVLHPRRHGNCCVTNCPTLWNSSDRQFLHRPRFVESHVWNELTYRREHGDASTGALATMPSQGDRSIYRNM